MEIYAYPMRSEFPRMEVRYLIPMTILVRRKGFSVAKFQDVVGALLQTAGSELH